MATNIHAQSFRQAATEAKMIIWTDGDPTKAVEQFKAAHASEGAAINALLDYLKSGGRDPAEVKRLTNEMTATHDAKMQLYAQYEQS